MAIARPNDSPRWRPVLCTFGECLAYLKRRQHLASGNPFANRREGEPPQVIARQRIARPSEELDPALTNFRRDAAPIPFFVFVR